MDSLPNGNSRIREIINWWTYVKNISVDYRDFPLDIWYQVLGWILVGQQFVARYAQNQLFSTLKINRTSKFPCPWMLTVIITEWCAHYTIYILYSMTSVMDFWGQGSTGSRFLLHNQFFYLTLTELQISYQVPKSYFQSRFWMLKAWINSDSFFIIIQNVRK